MIKKLFDMHKSNKQNDADIDFVVLWIDGKDKQWLADKARYSAGEKSKTAIDEDVSRYRDWDNLRYWFRGVEEYTPWVRKIHFVTSGHIPQWLDINNPKLNIVKHEDYIPKKYLPTFSSHPIELNLHRIEGLAEQFVYFNDDMFITRPMNQNDFFVNGMPCDQAQLSRIVSLDNDDVFPHIILNNIGMLNKFFDKNQVVRTNIFKWFSPKYGIVSNIRNLLLLPYAYFPGFSWNHLPSSFLKTTFEEVWRTDPETMDRVSSNKFRSMEDVNQYVMKEWQIVNGNFHPKNMFGRFGMLYDDISRQTDDACRAIENHQYSLICINDDKNFSEFEKTRDEINSSFDKKLPKKSSYETHDTPLKKISIIVPVYNGEKYLSRCLDSVISQTYKNIEIIIVDDGSCDESLMIGNEYASKDSRVRAYHKENGGVSSARNLGIKKATGEYITFVDADDFISNDMVGYLHSLACDSQADLSVVQYKALTINDSEAAFINGYHGIIQIFKPKDALENMLYQNDIENGPCGKLYNSSILKSLYFSENISIGEDVELNARFITKANKVVVSSAAMYIYFRHNNSATRSSFKHSKMDVFDALDGILASIDTNNMSLHRAVQRKEFTAATTTMFAMQNSKEFTDDYNRCASILKKNGLTVVFDSNASARDRMYAVVSIISVKLLFWSFRFKQFLRITINKLKKPQNMQTKGSV